MSIDNSVLYKYVSDLLRIPPACKYIEEAGGYIISTGLVWPIDATEGETVYYYINVVDQEVRFLPDFSADLSTAELVTDQNEILFVISHLQSYIKTVNRLEKAFGSDQILEIRFMEGKTPKINLTTQRALYFGNFSCS